MHSPRPRHQEMAVLDAEEVAAALETLEGTPWYLPFYLAVRTGTRRSELVAIRWSDVDLSSGQLSIVRTAHLLHGSRLVYREPKTPRSRRRIALSPATVLMLRAHRERQDSDAGPPIAPGSVR